MAEKAGAEAAAASHAPLCAATTKVTAFRQADVKVDDHEWHRKALPDGDAHATNILLKKGAVKDLLRTACP